MHPIERSWFQMSFYWIFCHRTACQLFSPLLRCFLLFLSKAFPFNFPHLTQQQNAVEPQNPTDDWVCFSLSLSKSAFLNLLIAPLFCSDQELWIHLISCLCLCTDNPSWFVPGRALLWLPAESAGNAVGVYFSDGLPCSDLATESLTVKCTVAWVQGRSLVTVFNASCTFSS